MAKLTVLNTAVTAGWAPDLFVGQSLISATATELRYSSVAGYVVVLSGRSFAYDADGEALRGTVETVTLYTAEGDLALRVEWPRARLDTLMRFAFGPVNDDGSLGTPDGAGFLSHILRGTDSVFGSGGNDTLFGAGSGGFGNDAIYGGAGDDLIRGDIGNDSLFGGVQSDTLSYESSMTDPLAYQGITLDVVLGTVIDCWGGVDTIGGFEAYRDSVFDDLMTGSTAASEVWHLGKGADTLNAGGGTDWLDYAGAGAQGGRRGLIVDLATGRVRDPWGEYDRVSGVEGVGGTARADVLQGDAYDNTFDGRRGQDSYDGRGGFDRIGFWGVTGANAQGVSIDMALSAGQILNDGFGNVETVAGIEAFTLSSFGDRFAGGAGTDNVQAGEGDDTLMGRDGEDYLFGSAGNDVIFGGDGAGHLTGGTGQDQLTGGSRDDDFAFYELGAANADTIYGFNASMDQIFLSVAWGGLSVGGIATNMLRVGSGVQTAVSSTQRILYNTSTGELFFDRDGAGGVAAELFAVLDNRPTLNIADFWVMG